MVNQKPKDSSVYLRRLKILLCILAAGNLLFLFLFDYKLPFRIAREDEPESSSEPAKNNDSAGFSSDIQIHFETDTLIYDGTDTFDPLTGVSVTSAFGNHTADELFITIQSGDRLNTKKITYTLEKNGQKHSEIRNLELQNYTGPSITFSENLPELSEDNTETIAENMIASGLVTAQDGYGNDISDSIQVNHILDEQNSFLHHYQFTVTNMFQDLCREDLDLLLKTDNPVLQLTASEVNITVGESFSALSYVSKAEDKDGRSLYEHISVDGSIDVRTPGTYILQYYATDQNGRKSPVKTLKVIVS